MVFISKMKILKNIKFRTGFVDTGLENVDVAAARVTERPSNCIELNWTVELNWIVELIRII